MNPHRAEEAPRTDAVQLEVHGPRQLAEVLPYLLGYYPDDSLVLIAVYDSGRRFGWRLRLDIPDSPERWDEASREVAECLADAGSAGERPPDGAVLYCCREPKGGGTGRQVMERLRPLVDHLRVSCGMLDVPIYEAVCLSQGLCWSYTCSDRECCPAEGVPQGRSGHSVVAAVAASAGVRVRGSLRELEARLAPFRHELVASQELALVQAQNAWMRKMIPEGGSESVKQETLALVRELLDRFRSSSPWKDEARSAPEASPTSGSRYRADDSYDDGLLSCEEAARLIVGLQDQPVRDAAGTWVGPGDAPAALRLWRALARRCVGGFTSHAPTLLSLAGWVSWNLGDIPAAQVAVQYALRRDPGHRLARLVHLACNTGAPPTAEMTLPAPRDGAERERL
ncbi:DUF4192 domain-containing protein [Streptomyces sp. NPDC005438]|uniref:DUF4192 domain-containing protein n=1 Tax=Streptomyces sp. NPDC005438 TaxID=3156880 RepID=UPI0033B79E0B